MTALSGFSSQIQQMDTMHMKLSHSMTFQSTPVNNNAAGGMTRRQKFKLEPIKILEPSNKKLSLPESQRIMYILEELVRKIELIEYVDTLANHLDRVREIVRENLNEEDKKKFFEEILVSMLQHHKSLIDAYNKGHFRVDDPADQQATNTTMQSKETLESLIKNSCKDILRVFHGKPALYEGIKNEFAKNKPKNNLTNELLGELDIRISFRGVYKRGNNFFFCYKCCKKLGLFKEAKDILLEKLLTTPTEQNEKIDYLKELLLREKSNNELIKKLKDEQNQALAEKDKEVNKKRLFLHGDFVLCYFSKSLIFKKNLLENPLIFT